MYNSESKQCGVPGCGMVADAAKEALVRLGVQWEPFSAEKTYQAGPTHIPARVVVSVKARLIGAFPTEIIFRY